MRLFLALAVPEAVRAALDRAVAPLRGRHPELGWTRPEGWHLTVAFLGEVTEPPGEVAEVVRPVVAAHPPVDLRLGAAGRFGDRVLWVAVIDQPSGAVAALGAALQRALADAGLPVDPKPVRPHLTLARRRRRPVTAAVVAEVPEVAAGWRAEEVVLTRSLLGGGRPATYVPLVRLPLGVS